MIDNRAAAQAAFAKMSETQRAQLQDAWKRVETLVLSLVPAKAKQFEAQHAVEYARSLFFAEVIKGLPADLAERNVRTAYETTPSQAEPVTPAAKTVQTGEYVVSREWNQYGPQDYLMAWDEAHGTACSALKVAMRFTTREAAQAAADKAAGLVPTLCGTGTAIRWGVVEITPSPKPGDETMADTVARAEADLARSPDLTHRNEFQARVYARKGRVLAVSGWHADRLDAVREVFAKRPTARSCDSARALGSFDIHHHERRDFLVSHQG